MANPVIRHSKTASSLPRLKRMLTLFVEERVMRAASQILTDFETLDWQDPKNVLEFRKRLRDEVKAALDSGNDPLTILEETGQEVKREHEALVCLYSAIVFYLAEKTFRDQVQNRWL